MAIREARPSGKAPEGSMEKAEDDEGSPESSRRRSGNRELQEGALCEEMFGHECGGCSHRAKGVAAWTGFASARRKK